MIDALLIHSAMSLPQLANFLKRAYSTTKDAAYKLKKAGAVNIQRGSVSLRR